jgi:hypothetical protein
MITRDIDSLTNSVMMEFEKVMRKNGVAPEFHPHYNGNRALIRGMIAMMVPSTKENPDDAGRKVPVLP